MDAFIDENLNNEKTYTPESIAWELLVGDIETNTKGKIYTPDNDITCNYEILITIFMELLFNIAKIDFYSEKGNVNFVPDYSEKNLKTLFSIVDNKLYALGYTVIVKEYNLNDGEMCKDIKDVIENRYCRVLLRNYDKDDIFNNIPENIYYHMKLNGLNKQKYNKLIEIYSLIFLNDKIYKINFIDI